MNKIYLWNCAAAAAAEESTFTFLPVHVSALVEQSTPGSVAGLCWVSSSIIFYHTRLQSPLFPFSGSLSSAARLHSSVTLPPPSLKLSAPSSFLHACFLSLHSHLLLSPTADQRGLNLTPGCCTLRFFCLIFDLGNGWGPRGEALCNQRSRGGTLQRVFSSCILF
jgi:hypothetical protein